VVIIAPLAGLRLSATVKASRNDMSLLDWIVLGILKSHAQAERVANDVVDLWHAGKLPGELTDVLV
jgi:hypothetical protein